MSCAKTCDRKGQALRPGDVVNVPCRVVGLTPGTDLLNIALETLELSPLTKLLSAIVTLHAAQVELACALGTSDPEATVERALSDVRSAITDCRK
jgi:hypothetical protein